MSEAAGKTFLEALSERYGTDDVDTYGADAFALGHGKKGKAKQWELVGMEQTRQKQSHHSKLFSIVLVGCVGRLEENKGEVAAANLRNVRDLDLSENPQLNRFEDLHYLAETMPRLESLQANRLCFQPIALKTPGPFRTMQRLILNYCNINRFSLLDELDAPMLGELHLEGCGIQTLDRCGLGFTFPKCRSLNLSNNLLSSWGPQSTEEPLHFGQVLLQAFPSVETLKLNGCPFPAFEPASNATDLSFLGQLTAFALCETVSWSTPRSLQVLSAMAPKLNWLSVSSTTIFAPLGEVQSRLLVIATIPQLKTLNLAMVRTAERVDAEVYYVQRAFSVEADDAKREIAFPRARLLRERLGDSIKVGSDANGPIHVVLPLTLRCLGYEDARMELPSTTTVEKLKLLASTIFKGAAPRRQSLSFVTSDGVGVSTPIPLDNDTQTLAYFGVGSNARIIIQLPEQQDTREKEKASEKA